MGTPPPPRSVIATEEPDGSPSSTIRMNSEKRLRIPSNFEGLSKIFRESYITTEYCLVANNHKLGGLYIIPSQESSCLWFGVLFVHHGPYQGGIFRFTLQIPEDYPDSHTVPAVTFQPPVFHPSIHATKGTFDLRRHFKSWNKTHHMWHILKVVKGAFYKIEGSTSNKAAHDMFENDPGSFVGRAQKDAEASQKRVYDPPPPEHARDGHWIKFSPYEAHLHDQIRAKALNPFEKHNSTFKNLTNTTTAVTSPRGTSFL